MTVAMITEEDVLVIDDGLPGITAQRLLQIVPPVREAGVPSSLCLYAAAAVPALPLCICGLAPCDCIRTCGL